MNFLVNDYIYLIIFTTLNLYIFSLKKLFIDYFSETFSMSIITTLDKSFVIIYRQTLMSYVFQAKEIVSRLPTSSDCVFIIPERLIQAKDITPDLFPLAVATSQVCLCYY